MNLFDVRDDVRAALRFEQLFGNRPGGYPANGFARTGAPAALPVANAVFGIVGIVGVRGPVDMAEGCIVFRFGIGVPHQNHNRRAQGFAFKDPR